MSKKPFIIKSKMIEPMIPVGSDLYDEVQESRIQIAQAANGYLTVNRISYPLDQYVLRKFQAAVVILALSRNLFCFRLSLHGFYGFELYLGDNLLYGVQGYPF